MTNTNPRDLLIEHDELLAKLSDVLWNYGTNDAARRVDAAVERLHNFLAQPESEAPTDEELLATQDQAVASFPPVHPDAEALSAVEYARELEIRKARAVLARWGK